jgi:D-alanyl-D-alanine dipeptidase
MQNLKLSFLGTYQLELEKYVENPINRSVHNYGFALDLSPIDEKSKELDMGTAVF